MSILAAHNNRRYIMPREDDRKFCPVNVHPKNLTEDIKRLKEHEHADLERKKEYFADIRFASTLLKDAKKLGIGNLPDRVENIDNLNEFITMLERQIEFKKRQYNS